MVNLPWPIYVRHFELQQDAIERLGQECLASNALANTISSLFTTVSSDEAVE